MLGSGSTYIYGYCDAAFRPNMSQTDAEQFVTHGNLLHRFYIFLFNYWL